jgi:hypothetical protein
MKEYLKNPCTSDLKTKDNLDYIALSSMCKENIDDIIEWLEYHKAIGIDKFILYNNDSNQDLANLLPQHLKDTCLVIDWFYDFDGRQIVAQQHCIKKFSNFKWIGFIDIDEYIVLLDEDINIKSYIKDYEAFGGICLHWLLFGSNGHTNRQTSTIYSYTQSCPNHGANEHIKSIIDPKQYIGKHNDPHWLPTKNGNVNTKKEKVSDAFGSIRAEHKAPLIDYRMRINHYYTKSYEDFSNKKLRKGGNKVNREYKDSHFDNHQRENVYNNYIVVLYDKIKALYGTSN